MLTRRAAQDASIPAIQGRTHVSPLVGRVVRSTGVVTAVGRSELYVQDRAGDGDPGTSDALVVRGRIPGVTPGDEVRFAGTVVEVVPGGRRTANLSVTTVEATRLEILRRGGKPPSPVVIGRNGRRPPTQHVISPDELPVNLRIEAEVRRNRFDPASDAIDFFEALEGMLVTVRRPVAVSATHTFSPAQSEIVTLPDAGEGVDPVRRTTAGGILLRSGRENLGSQNPERIQIQLDAELFPGPVPRVGVGDRLGDVTGVLRYDFGNYEVAATQRFEVAGADREPETTTLIGTDDRITVSSYNVYNLDGTAADSAQRRLLARQIVDRLRSPDVLALQEIQDDNGEVDDGTVRADGTLRALAEAIAAAGGPRYHFVNVAPADGRAGGAPGANIRNAFLYDPARVTLRSCLSLSPGRLAAAGVRDAGAFRNARDPLLGVFEKGGRSLTVLNNHLSSRFGSTPVFGAIQPFVQAGEEERAAQVRALHDYVAHMLDRDSAARIVVLGDLNTFEYTDHLRLVLPGTPAILHSLWGGLPPGDRYTYNFEGNSQVLDHVFVSGALRTGAELDVVHLNVDFPALPGAVASDHDPLVARFR